MKQQRLESHEMAASRAPATRYWRWRVVDGEPIHVRDTIRVGAAMREMLMEAARWSRGSHVLPLCLHGPTLDHSHARYMPEDTDGDGIIDQLTVYAAGGLDGVALRLLAMSERLIVAGLGAHDLEPLAMGARGDGALFGRSTVWESRTPWVAPWHKDPTQRQVRKELPLAGMATETTGNVVVEELRRVRANEYELVRSEENTPPSLPWVRMLRLTFLQQVDGPIALGHGSHFGLGQFVPA